jgi:hypothetical protein
MALAAEIISLIRDEIGTDLDVTDNDPPPANGIQDSLENIYTDPDRGNSSIFLTALIVWRRRLANHQSRAFDFSKEGNWFARNQKSKFLKGMVDKYERLAGLSGSGAPHRNGQMTSAAMREAP